MPYSNSGMHRHLQQIPGCNNNMMKPPILKFLIGRNGMYLHPAPEHLVLQFEWHT
jgi:hypothetical protein